MNYGNYMPYESHVIWQYSNGSKKKEFVRNKFLKEYDRQYRLTRELNLVSGEESFFENDVLLKKITKDINSMTCIHDRDIFLKFLYTEYFPGTNIVKVSGTILRNLFEMENGICYGLYDDSNNWVDTFTEYYIDGNIKTTGNYLHNKKIGKWICYNENGIEESSEVFK